MVQKINSVNTYLNRHGFELSGSKADGNCFFHAFLGSYDTLYIKIPLLDQEKDQVSYLRKVVTSQYEKSAQGSKNVERNLEIQKDTIWITANGEGDLLAHALSIPIRVVTVNKDETGSGVSDMLTFSKLENQTKSLERQS